MAPGHSGVLYIRNFTGPFSPSSRLCCRRPSRLPFDLLCFALCSPHHSRPSPTILPDCLCLCLEFHLAQDRIVDPRFDHRVELSVISQRPIPVPCQGTCSWLMESATKCILILHQPSADRQLARRNPARSSGLCPTSLLVPRCQANRSTRPFTRNSPQRPASPPRNQSARPPRPSQPDLGKRSRPFSGTGDSVGRQIRLKQGLEASVPFSRQAGASLIGSEEQPQQSFWSG